MSMDNAPLRFPECVACGQGVDENDASTPHILLNKEFLHETCVDVAELDDDELKIVWENASSELERKAKNEIDNRAENAGVREEERRFAEYWGGGITSEDRERQQLREAGRM